MKKYVLVCIINCISVVSVNAQNIPNPSFDSVYFGGIDRVFEWITSDGVMMYSGFFNDTVPPLTPNTFYDAMGLQFSELLWLTNQVDVSPFSSIAMELMNRPKIYQADGSQFESFVINGSHFFTDSDGYVDLSRCGVPFPHRPSAIKGQYLFVDSTTTAANFGKCVVLLSKWNTTLHQRDTIAFLSSSNNLNPSSSWSAFSIPLSYQSTQTPDSIMVAFLGNAQPQNASSFKIDEVAFEYGGIGLEEISRFSGLAYYPNPANGFIWFEDEITSFRSVTIYDQSGSLISEKTFTNPLHVSELAAGIYFLKLTNALNSSQILKISIFRN